MAVAYDIPHGSKVYIHHKGNTYLGEVLENVKDNDRAIVVMTYEKHPTSTYLNGHGWTVGYESSDIEIVRPSWEAGEQEQL